MAAPAKELYELDRQLTRGELIAALELVPGRLPRP
jgi:hypothetical protein